MGIDAGQSLSASAAETKTAFYRYDDHYRRMLNVPPDWAVAAKDPDRFALKAPWLPTSRTARILDFGCGWGKLLMGLWAAGYKNLEGIELAQEQASMARQACAGLVTIYCADGAEYLRDKNSVYDLVILSDVIEHIQPDRVATVLRHIHQSLVPGGTLAIRTPNMASILASFSRYTDITHVAGYTEFSLTQLLDQTGFVDHTFVAEKLQQWSAWRPWAPWRGLGLAGLANIIVHKTLYCLRRQNPKPKEFGYNLEVFTRRRG